ncbi:hypothetical protein GT347_22655 [Xylophilus rhododendri]|uniref:Uncharacterized protein n=1 Tax=Xylophilus rhododendri TaxID=2697032 RepID=A0A857J9X4_9BURK|nr:hypothetical protein [Xylophilus rhododendri]QHJ00528.1 hypothetical protein GT347_22655 [Xylophilus rhododendri]
MTSLSRLAPALLAALAVFSATGAAAAALCSSDSKAPPRVIVERFLPDTCSQCWSRPVAQADRGAFTIDWIVPGDDSQAPLAAAALPEASERLAALGYTPETPEPQFWKWRHPVVSAQGGKLRVAQGPAVNDYLGVSIGWTPPPAAAGGPFDAWLLLIEDLPAGSAGATGARRLVRGALSVEHIALDAKGWSERRSMHIPEGADPAKLRLVGWIADDRGRLIASAASHCTP